MNNDGIPNRDKEELAPSTSTSTSRKKFPKSAGGTSKIIILEVLIITIVVIIVNVVGMSTVLKVNTIGRRGCYRRVLFQHRSSSSSSSSSTLSATTRRSRISCRTGNISRSTYSAYSSSSSPFWPRTSISSPSSPSIIMRMASRSSDESGDISSSSSSSSKESIVQKSSKNLLSIEECFDQYNNRHFDNDTNTNNSIIQFIDATWFHKGIRNGRKEFENGPRLPGAAHWDISDLSTNGELFPNDNPKKLKNVFPSQWLVGAALEKMGVINNSNSNNNKSTTTNIMKTILVVYGREGTLFAPRVWYTLKKYYCGSGSVKLLQGSLEEWIAKGGPADFDPITTATNTTTKIYSNSSRNRNDNNSIEPATIAVSIRAKDLIEESGHRWRDNRYKHPSISWSTAKNRLVDMQFVLDFLDYKQQQRKEEEDDEPSSSSILKEELELLLSSSSPSNNHHNDSGNDKWPSVIIDTRGSSFSKKGHIPGSIHIPYSSLTMKDDPFKLKTKIELKKVIRDALLGREADNADDEDEDDDDDDDDDSLLFEMLRHRPPLLTCGTGVSVCTMALALEELGLPEPFIYDGSWNEWGQDPSTPKAGISK